MRAASLAAVAGRAGSLGPTPVTIWRSQRGSITRKSMTARVAGQRREALICRSSSATCQRSPANGSVPA